MFLLNWLRSGFGLERLSLMLLTLLLEAECPAKKMQTVSSIQIIIINAIHIFSFKKLKHCKFCLYILIL